MKVKILKTIKNVGINKDEIYEAQPYWLDEAKINLIKRIQDGYNPQCNVYKSEIKILSK